MKILLMLSHRVSVPLPVGEVPIIPDLSESFEHIAKNVLSLVSGRHIYLQA